MSENSTLPSAEEILERHYKANLQRTVAETLTYEQVAIGAMKEYGVLVRNAYVDKAAAEAERFLKDHDREFWGEILSKSIKMLKYE